MSEADLPSDTLFVVEFLCRHKWVSNGHYAAAAAAKSFQSCLTLCDPIDGSPPGFPVPKRDFLKSIAAAGAAKLLQSCPTLHDPMDCSPPGSFAHGIFQERALE